LESHRKELESNGIFEQTEKNKESTEVKNFNHSYHQGLLLTVGNLRGKNTFVPNQEKKRFDERTLGQIRTLNSILEYSFSEIVQRSSTIDVIWFNQRNMPDSFFEVEHSTLAYRGARLCHIKFQKNSKQKLLFPVCTI